MSACNMIIPKKIHYCWFGKKPMTKTIQKCIASWKIHLPDFEIILWNETNAELTHPFVQKALRDKKWAFVSDYVRLKALVDYGGVYLDTDMLILKDFSELLSQPCFVGLESERYVSCGVIGAHENHPYILECLRRYDAVDVSKPINYKDLIIPKVFTTVFKLRYDVKDLVAQQYRDVLLLDVHSFYPYPNPDPNKRRQEGDYLQYINEDSFAVHLWERSWAGYNEFQLINQRRYLKAFISMVRSGNQKGLEPHIYFKKLMSTLTNSIIKRHEK